MGKKKICPNCNKEGKDSKKQRIERSIVMRMLKGIKVAGIKEKDEDTKDLCFECWKKEMRSMMKPYAEQLGKSAENW